MEEEIARSKKKNIIRIVGLAVILAIVGLIVWLSSIKHLGDPGFFATDNTQYVIEEEGGVFGASKVYQVYKYSGNKVTDATTYYEFEEESVAKEYFEEWLDTIKVYSVASEVKLEGRYIIAIVEKAQYVNWTVDDLKEMYEESEARKKEREDREHEMEEELEHDREHDSEEDIEYIEDQELIEE